MFRCQVCGTRSIGSRGETVFDDAYYERNYEQPGRLAAYADVVERAAAIIPAGARVLDVGCGAGHLVVALRERGYDVVGVDPSEAARRAASKHDVEPYASIRDVGGEPFAAVFLVDVVAHVADARALAREAIGALAPDGLLVVRTPAVSSALVAAEAVVTLGGGIAASPLLHRSSRMHFFDASSLKGALALWGLHDVAATPTAETIVRDDAHPTMGALAQRLQRALAHGGSLLAIGYRR